MAIDEVVLARLRDKFTEEWKKIEHYESRRPLPKNPEKIADYKESIISTFNAICKYLGQIYGASDNIECKLECIARIKPYINKTKRAFEALKLTYEWPVEELASINIDLVGPRGKSLTSTSEAEQQPATDTDQTQSNKDAVESSTSKSDQNQSDDARLDEIIHDLSNIEFDEGDLEQVQATENHDPTDQTVQQNAAAVGQHGTGDSNSQGNLNMPQSKQDFFKIASSVLNYRFDGDPLKLESFIEDAEFVSAMTEDENKEVCLQFIRTKIAGKAKECLPDEAAIKEWNDIKTALKKEIKHDSSLVIEGKFASLRITKGNYTKFSEEAENLAEAYRRSLIFEKFTRDKASEMKIRKTKELCRQMSRSDVAKSVIDSTRYDNPAEVIATFITQNDIARKEKKEQEQFQKRPANKGGYKGQKYNNKGNKPNNNNSKGQKYGKFNKNKSNDQQNGKSRGNRNDHVIRIVSDATPSTSNESNSSNAEQVFRLAPS